jgi:hypothetical protein
MFYKLYKGSGSGLQILLNIEEYQYISGKGNNAGVKVRIIVCLSISI